MSETTERSAAEVATMTAPAVKARHDNLLERVIEQTVQSGFDADAWHVMDQRDTRLIQDEIMGGARSSKFVYDFSIGGTAVRGISAVGARELASHYGKIRHRLVSSTRKIGKLFVFTTYASPGVNPSMQTQVLPELASEPDGYEAVCEVQDINSGNSMMAAKFESQFEWVTGKNGQEGRWREKSHFATIAQSKAQRNGILMVIPQAIQLEWMESMKGLGKNDVITTSVLEEKRDGVLKYGAAQGVSINRQVLETLLLDQIAGLSEAARTKNMGDFLASCIALGLIPPIPAEEPTRETVRSGGRPPKADRPAPARQADGKPDPRANGQAAPTDAERQTARQTPDDGIPTDRWEQEASKDTGPQSTDAPKQTEPQAAGVSVSPKASAVAFSEYLVDGEGSEIPDADGVLEAITDPIAFANLYAQVRSTMFPGDLEDFDKANHDALARAQAAAPGVAAIIVSARGGAKTIAEPGLPMDLPHDPTVVFAPPAEPTKADYDKYKASFEQVLASATTPDAINHAINVNEPVYGKFPPSHRLACKALVEARQKALSPAPERGAVRSASDVADSVLRDLAAMETLSEFDTWKLSATVTAELDRLANEAPDQRRRIADAMEKHHRELTALSPTLKSSENIPVGPETIPASLFGDDPVAQLDPQAEGVRIRDKMLAALEACQTRAEVNKWGSQAEAIQDGKFLQERHPELWAEVAAVGSTRHKPVAA